MRRRLARLRVAARIARRDARRARGRTALVAALVGLPVLAGAALGTLFQSSFLTPAAYADQVLGDTAQARISAHLGDDVLQAPDATSSSAGDWADPPDVATHRASLEAVLPDADTLVEVVVGKVTLATDARAVRSPVEAAEEPAEPALASRHRVSAGALPARPGEIALGARLADTLGIGPGDGVTVTPADGDPVDVVVCGLLGPGSTGADVVAWPGTLFAPPTSAASEWATGTAAVEWYVLGPEPVTWEDVVAVNDVGSTVVSRAVILDPPHPSEVAWDVGGGSDERIGVAGVAAGVAAIVLLEAVLLVGPAFAVGARRAERRLGILAAVGAEPRTLGDVLLLTGAGIGAVASTVAVALGVGLAAAIRAVLRARGDLVSFPDLRVPWPALGGMVAVGVLVATAAAWLPARRARGVDVVAALEGRRVDAPVRRRVPVTGLALLAGGTLAAAAGAARGSALVMVGGILAVEVGVVAVSGGMVALAARLAPRLGVAGRLALRDAARHRSRTAPAVAAVIAAVGGMVAAATYVQAEGRAWAEQYAPVGPTGLVAVSYAAPGEPAPGDPAPGLRASSEAALAVLPVTDVVPVRMAVPRSDGDSAPEPAAAATAPGGMLAFRIEPPPGAGCPQDAVPLPDGCTPPSAWSHAAWPSAGSGLMVDDGSAMGVLGSPEAAAGLVAGLVVVPRERDLWPDGTVHLEVTEISTDGADGRVEMIVLPAVVAPVPTSAAELVVPPSALDALGLAAQDVGLAAATSRMPTAAEVAAATADLDPAADIYVERGPGATGDGTSLALLLAAVVVAVAACGIAVALAVADARPDLATMAAVGASPRVRRRVAAAQAAVVAGLGVSVGLVTGLVLGAVLVTARNAAPGAEGVWELAAPWPAVAAGAGLPLLAVAGAWALTRSQLPMARRVAV